MNVRAQLPAAWPDGRKVALSVSIMLEGWTDDSAPGVGPMGNVLKAGALDLQARSWADYGPQVGAWRLLDVLAETEVQAVFYVSGILAERQPALLRAIADAGHAVAGHSWAQNIIPATQPREEEAADLERCIAAIAASAGQRPRGWISPRCTPSTSTAELLVQAGLPWHADYFDTDLPRMLTTPAGPLVAVPFTMEVNDMPLYIRYGNEPGAYTAILKRLLEQWPAPDGRPFCLDVTAHAHVFGRPFGAAEFREALRLARQSELVWMTNHDEVARAFSPA